MPRGRALGIPLRGTKIRRKIILFLDCFSGFGFNLAGAFDSNPDTYSPAWPGLKMFDFMRVKYKMEFC